MSNQTINRVSSYLVHGLSLFALCLVSGATILTMLGKFNPSPDGDEGAAAHLFQLIGASRCGSRDASWCQLPS